MYDLLLVILLVAGGLVWFGLTIFNEGAYLTFKSVFHKALMYFSSTVKSRSNPFLEPTSTKQ